MYKKASSKRLVQIFLTSVLSVSAYSAMAVDDFDMEKVAQCVACHGADGIGKATEYPDLQGKPVEYLVAQLQYFKSGLRSNSTMNLVAKPLSQAEIHMLAKYFEQAQ